MNTEQQSSFSGWAKVEVIGHQSHVGFVRTEAYGGAVLFRIDTPELPEREYVLTEAAYAQDGDNPDLTTWCRKGSKVRRLATPGVSVLVGAGSIYRIIPCSEAAAMKAIEESARSPLKVLELATQLALEEAKEDEGEEDDACPNCSLPEMGCECV